MLQSSFSMDLVQASAETSSQYGQKNIRNELKNRKIMLTLSFREVIDMIEMKTKELVVNLVNNKITIFPMKRSRKRNLKMGPSKSTSEIIPKKHFY